MKPLLDLPWRSCKWPVAEQGGTHLFCGAPLSPGTSEKCFYCAEHERLSRVPTARWTLAASDARAEFFVRNERIVVKGGPDAVKDLVEEIGE